MVYVFSINQPSLPTPFYSVLGLFFSYGPFNCISFHKFSQQFSAFSLCSSNLISALLVLSTVYIFINVSPIDLLHWGAADAEIKVPSVEDTELKCSPFKAWSRAVRLLPGISSLLIYTLPVHSSAFFQKNFPNFFLCWLWLTPVPA